MNTDNIPQKHILGNYHPTKIDKVRELSAQEIQLYETHKSTITEYDSQHRLINIVELNYTELKNFLTALENNTITFNDPRLNADRLVMNYLSSFRSLTDHLESHKISYQNRWKEIEKLLHDLFDKYFSYRFMYKLRNYAQHYECPVATFSISKAQNRNEVRLFCDKKRLLNAGTDIWGSKIFTELEMLPKDEIDLSSIISEHVNVLDKIRQLLNHQMLPLLEEAINFINKLSDEARKLNPNGVPCIIVKWDETGNEINISFELMPRLKIEKRSNNSSL
ncbi:MAG: hypothetical protein PHR77_12120 [Kiritimatiellae bacterium]|nr:hypothetical protein [Kiritimatiellia bacterium]MDD5519494.1 hypothetical protein [Kiritimatiellia bacterium]